jgi:DNA-binding NtrC family response regulator
MCIVHYRGESGNGKELVARSFRALGTGQPAAPGIERHCN